MSAGNQFRILWCLVKGDNEPFEVTAPGTVSVAGLKELVYAKNDKGILSNINAKDLILWKVRNR
jgi:hypothetical protein